MAYKLIFLPCLLCIFIASAEANLQLSPGLYIFGDSTIDGGNFPQLNPAYGIDLNDTTLPHRATNGLTIADFIATFLGLPLVPAFKSSQAGNSTNGINYGASGCGILPETGPLFHTNCWSFDMQITKFNESITNNLTKLFNQQELVKHLAESVFLISFGINDYSQNYLGPPVNTSLKNLEPEVFANYLLNELSFRLTTLHGLGARKFLVNNIWPLGCSPWYFAANESDPASQFLCNEKINQLLLPYNTSLPRMLSNLQSSLAGFSFSTTNDFQFVTDLKHNTARYGITNTTGRCLSLPNGGTPCRDRDHFLYYDIIHTTQEANFIWALNCFNGTLCTPRNVVQLVGGGVV